MGRNRRKREKERKREMRSRYGHSEGEERARQNVRRIGCSFGKVQGGARDQEEIKVGKCASAWVAFPGPDEKSGRGAGANGREGAAKAAR